MPIKLKFINENHGIGKNSGKPYHMIKFADPETYENHTLSVDSAYLQPPLNLISGQLVEVEGRLSTPFNTTQFLVTSVKPIKEA